MSRSNQILTSSEHALVRDFPKWKFRFSRVTRRVFATLEECQSPISKIKVATGNMTLARAVLSGFDKACASKAAKEAATS